ncbi:MAG: alpha-amylase family glycosyl hydrolase [Terracidiphilus sp.]
MLLKRLLVVAVLIHGILASGQGKPVCSAEQNITRPCIDEIDPPGWWTGLPSPMLLVHGKNLNEAHFQVTGNGVELNRTQISANGHWAFLWIETGSAAAQTLWVTASNDKGEARHIFALAERSRDPNAHRGFSSDDVLYLIMTDRFARGKSAVDPPGDNRTAPRGWHGGNLAGIEQHLDYVKQLGATTVWTTPLASNGSMPESYHGYAATDLYGVDPHFGSLEDYRNLSGALHARGMKLVIDLAPNHIGIAHLWVRDPPAPEWLHGTLEHHRAAQSDFYQLVDPHAPPRAWLNITDGWFADAMPDLNQENPLVARYLTQNALWWVETANLDGIRLDTFPYVSRAFWRDFDATLHSVYPHLTAVGEIFNRDPEITSYFAGGVVHQGIDTGLDTPFDFPVYFALRDVLAHGKPMTELAAVLRQDALYPHPERLVPFIGNHDTTRFFTDAGNSVPKLKLALGLLTTLRGMPQIYSGDEIAMDGGKDPDNRRDFPGGFPGDARDAFTKAGRTPVEQEIFAWTSGMLALRAAHPELRTGLEQNLFADDDVFAFVRTLEIGGCPASPASGSAQERFLIVINKSQSSKALDLPAEETALAGCTKFQPEAPATGTAPVFGNGKLHIVEQAESMTVFDVR